MISKESLINNLSNLSTPRLSGTTDERKVFNFLKELIINLKVTPTFQDFSFSTFYSRIYSKIAFTLCSWLLFVLLLNFEPIFRIINITAILVTFLAFYFIRKNPEKISFGKVLNSQNLYVKLPPMSEKSTLETRDIFIFSHLDSKGQKLHIDLRVNIIRLWIFSFAICFGLTLSFYFFPLIILFIPGFVFLALNLIAAFFLDINTTNNTSPGALDNASGSTCNFELLKYFSVMQNRLQNYNIWFVFTGAEECGTMGIRHFYKRIIRDFDRNRTIVINIDGIGQGFNFFSNYITPKKNPILYNVIVEKGRKLGLDLSHTKARLGVRSDGLYLRSKGFVEFGFADVIPHNFVHSSRDIVENIYPSVLKTFCDLIVSILKEVDQNPEEIKI